MLTKKTIVDFARLSMRYSDRPVSDLREAHKHRDRPKRSYVGIQVNTVPQAATPGPEVRITRTGKQRCKARSRS